MKKLLLVIAAVAMLLPSCKKINEAIDDLNNRVTELENTTIPTINEQIANINTSIADLEAADVELKNYIIALQGTAAELQKSINTTNTRIDEVKAALQKEIEESNAENLAQLQAAKADVLAQLEALRAEMNNELTQINSTIATLQAKDTELEVKITELRNYVDTELKNTKDWATATFSTLEQYNALCSEVATIKTQIENLNKSISELETRLNSKIATDIATAVKDLQGELADAVTDITNSYTSAISTAKNEITAAYTVAIQSAISALETSMKQWVGEQLADYYTIAESEAKLAALKADLEAQLAVQKTYCESLMTALTNNMTEQVGNLQKQIDAINKTIAELNKEIETLYSKLEQTKAEITVAYTEAIAKAIEENEGKWSDALAKEVEALNELIEKNNIAAFNAFAEEANSRIEALEADVAAIKQQIANILSEIVDMKEDIAKLIARIQSVSYVPKYSDGKADIDYDTKTVELDFQVSPKSAIADLTKLWKSALTAKTSYTATRAVSYLNTPIIGYSADEENATIAITVSLNNLDEEFFDGIKEASMALQISDGNSFVSSDYVGVYDRNLYEIRYISTNDVALDKAPEISENTLISHSYHDGVGVIRYSAPIRTLPDKVFDQRQISSIELPRTITFIPDFAFRNCKTLISIVIPNNTTSIGYNAFSGCISLTNVTLPNRVTKIGDEAFTGCTSLTNITIGNSVTSIDRAFYGCSSLMTIYCKPTIPPAIYWFAYRSYGSFPKNSGMKIYVPRNSYDAYKQYSGYTEDSIAQTNWSQYESYIEPYDFE